MTIGKFLTKILDKILPSGEELLMEKIMEWIKFDVNDRTTWPDGDGSEFRQRFLFYMPCNIRDPGAIRSLARVIY